MSKAAWPWRWHSGFCVPHPELVPFLKNVLKSPHDETLRLVLADWIEDLTGDSTATRGLRLSGRWQLGGAVSRYSAGLSWWPTTEGHGHCLGYVGRRNLPLCPWCGRKPKYQNCTMMIPGGSFFQCVVCEYGERR